LADRLLLPERRAEGVALRDPATVRSIAACASPMAMAPSTIRSFWKLRMMA
jgi:hypothetical protein